MEFENYQNLASSEKVVLATLDASKRLMGWALHSGSIYKLEDFDFPVVVSVEDSGTPYTEVGSIGAVTASKYYLDRTNKILYVRTTGSDNPNGRFIAVTLRLFFANVPIVLPWDLDNGFEVFWEPTIKTNSEFGVVIDTINQTSEAIEGAGSLTLVNDQDYWLSKFDKLLFENQRVFLYSYHRELAPTEAKYIFKGRIDKKSYTPGTIVFQLKDQFAELRAEILLDTIGSLGARTGDDLANAKQRMILGRVFGMIPTNIDQVLEGYPITGVVDIDIGDLVLTGTGTQFLTELSPDDRIIIAGSEFTVASITDDSTAELTEEYTGNHNISGEAITVLPARPKRYTNRIFKVSGHVLREPLTTVIDDSNILTLKVDDTSDIYPDDWIYVGALGSGELVQVDSIIGANYIRLATSLATVPPIGTEILRPAIQRVMIDNVSLFYYRDYTFDAETGVLTLRETAESNAAPIYQMGNNITFTNSSRDVSGSGFRGVIQPGYMLGMLGHAEFFEVLQVIDDSNLKLRTAATFTDTDKGQYKSLIYDEGDTVLSLDALGRTDDGTTTGALLATGPSISRALLEDAGLENEIDSASFDESEELAYQHVGLVIPDSYTSDASQIYRDVLNTVNKSVFGALVQNVDFKFQYQVLQPSKTIGATRFTESDILSFGLTSTAEKVVKTVIIEFKPKEYNFLVKTDSVETQQKTGDNANYLLKTDRTRTISTILVEEADAEIMANRWSFLLSNSSGRLTFKTKLQGAMLEIGNIIEIEHRKLFERFGSSGQRKLLMVEAVKRNGSTVSVEATDLSNTFNRVACINSFSNEWPDATETERLFGGYITDQYGLIDNNPESFETNLIW